MEQINIFLDAILFSWVGILVLIFSLVFLIKEIILFKGDKWEVKGNNLLYIGLSISYLITFIIKIIWNLI